MHRVSVCIYIHTEQMCHAALELGEVVSYPVHNLQQPRNNKRIAISTNLRNHTIVEPKTCGWGTQGWRGGGTLGVMRWQPRRCGGMTTVLWAQRGANEPAADDGAEAASSHRTAPAPARATAGLRGDGGSRGDDGRSPRGCCRLHHWIERRRGEGVCGDLRRAAAVDSTSHFFLCGSEFICSFVSWIISLVLNFAKYSLIP